MSDASPRDPSPVLLFDGGCNLCHGFVRWVVARDRRAEFRFAALQSHAARRVLESVSVAPESLPDSVVLVLPGQSPQVKSDAVLAVAARLGFPWSLTRCGRVLPRRLRNHIYDWVAARRYRWFGRHKQCLVPAPKLLSRFLDAAEFSGIGPQDPHPGGRGEIQ